MQLSAQRQASCRRRETLQRTLSDGWQGAGRRSSSFGRRSERLRGWRGMEDDADHGSLARTSYRVTSWSLGNSILDLFVGAAVFRRCSVQ